MNDVIKWLESEEGENWSKGTHKKLGFYDAYALVTVKSEDFVNDVIYNDIHAVLWQCPA